MTWSNRPISDSWELGDNRRTPGLEGSTCFALRETFCGMSFEGRRRSDGNRLDSGRKRLLGGGVDYRGGGEEGEAQGLTCESRIDVRRAFEALGARDRELLWLAYVVGLSHREIAKVARVGESSVRVLLYRARSRFSKVLEGRGIGPDDLA